MSDQFAHKFNQLFASSKQVLLTTHQNPDDDAISSVLATKHVLDNNFPQVTTHIVIESPLSNKWHMFAGFDQIVTTEDLGPYLDQSEVAVFLDGNQYHRFTNNPDKIAAYDGKKICIDHHSSKADNFDLIYANSQASATAEILFDLFYVKNSELAKILLMGILGDTGNLVHVNYTQSQVFSRVKTLVEDAKVQIRSFTATYTHLSPEVIALVKTLINNQKNYKVENWPEFKISYLPLEVYQEYGIVQVKEAIDFYLMNFNLIEHNISWSLTFYPSGQGVSISARSILGSVNVRCLMEELGIGGGHDLAAGGIIKPAREVDLVIGDILAKLIKLKPVLTAL